ncbi:formin-like protein 3, partial [Ananas comosus]|uniref:Formin-like protein 3 n=1 Tax=Ananas comosus TaxID=4615 RepID=A0A6P5EE75_ANACO
MPIKTTTRKLATTATGKTAAKTTGTTVKTTGTTVLGKTAAPCPRQLGDPLRRSIERTGAVNVISSGLSIDLERRFQELKHHLGNGVMATTHPSSSSINDRSLAKKVIWADSAGLDLAQVTFFSKDDSPTAPTPSAPAPAVKDTDGKGAPADQPWTEVHYKRNGRLAPPGKPSYKEALLSAAPPSSSRNPPSPLRNALSRNPPPPPLRFAPAHRSRASLPSRHPPPPLRNTLRNTPPKRSFKDRMLPPPFTLLSPPPPNFNHIDKRIEGWKAKLLSQGGRLILMNSVLSNMPLQFLSIFKAPQWALRQIESLRRAFFWRGRTNISGGACL